jgi:MinD-like ATPase involved in chromosome partitioning or flagellar assembly
MSSQLDSLRRFLHTGGARPAPGGRTGALVVGSGKGGSGTSTFAALLALLAAAEGRQTLLVDADRSLPTLHLLLGVEAGPGLGALRGDLAPEQLLVPAAPGLTLLTCGAPLDEEAPALGEGEWQALFRRIVPLYGDYERVIVDGGSRLAGVAGAVGAGAGRLLAVTAADRVSLAATHALVKACTARSPGLPTSVALNRTGEGEGRAAFEVVEAGVGHFLARSLDFAGAVPEEPRFRQGVESGLTLQQAAANAALTTALRQLAARLWPAAPTYPRATATR